MSRGLGGVVLALGVLILSLPAVAAEEPLFGPPPLVGQEAEIQLSAYRQAPSPAELSDGVHRLPPAPVPMKLGSFGARGHAVAGDAEPNRLPERAPRLKPLMIPAAPVPVDLTARKLKAPPVMPPASVPVMPLLEPVAPVWCCPSQPSCGACDSCRHTGGGWALSGMDIVRNSRLRFGGWIDQGVSVVSNQPDDRYNGVVTFNDRDGEYQGNQLWLYLEREADSCGCGFDIGGRIDALYGTDARFLQAADGLESDWGQSEPFYQVAIPQFYVDVALNDWRVRAGRFLTILGHESPAAPDNFFYSHSYTMQYGEPFTHLGVLVSRPVGRRWTLNCGFHRGNDQFDDTDGLDALNLLGGIGWTSIDGRASATYAFSSTEEGPNRLGYIQSVVATVDLSDRWTYVIQSDYGEIFDKTRRHKDAWYGINQYLTYQINPWWAAGVRTEWFRDHDGTRVTGIGVGNQNQGQFVGDFYQISLGLNWSPAENLVVRPEIRWDIFDAKPAAVGAPFDAGQSNRQFLFGCDLVYMF